MIHTDGILTLTV